MHGLVYLDIGICVVGKRMQDLGWPGARSGCDDEIIPSMQSLGQILVEDKKLRRFAGAHGRGQLESMGPERLGLTSTPW